MEVILENNVNIKEIITALKKGFVLVLPTDTVYGLVCDATNKKAVEEIFKIKKRDKSKSLPVFVENIKMAKKYAIINKIQESFINKNWPGAVTVILKSKKGLSPLVYKNDTIALRQPNYNLIKEIFKNFKKPLAQTSANTSGHPPLDNGEEINNVLGCEKYCPALVVDAGNLLRKKPSTIIDLTNNNIKILRT